MFIVSSGRTFRSLAQSAGGGPSKGPVRFPAIRRPVMVYTCRYAEGALECGGPTRRMAGVRDPWEVVSYRDDQTLSASHGSTGTCGKDTECGSRLSTPASTTEMQRRWFLASCNSHYLESQSIGQIPVTWRLSTHSERGEKKSRSPHHHRRPFHDGEGHALSLYVM